MAKKGQAVQLQTEINSDEDWEKLLQKDGLIVVDIYSKWCGPCSGMAATLKKLKLEIGGDTLQLAIAKCDRIQALERFRNKSEPTWMFISGGKMVNFMFGASAPRLTQLITEELKKETEAKEGKRERGGSEISELADEERVRFEAKEKIALAAKAAEEAKSAKELRERRVAECQNILNNLPAMGVILVFPHAKDRYMEVFGDLLLEAALAIQTTEKVQLTEDSLEELFYFSETQPPEVLMEEMLSTKTTALLLKRSPENLPSTIDDVISQMVYGNLRKPPGDDNCPYRVGLLTNDNGSEIPAFWTPPNPHAKATALKLLFPNISGPYKLPEVVPIPPHVAVGYDAFKYEDVIELAAQYPGQVMKYGFFTSDIPGDAQLIAKTVEKFEKRETPHTYEEKIIIQLAKTQADCILAFSELGPSYMSANVVQGEDECKIFFPEGYDIPEESVAEVKKKSKKKSKAKPAVHVQEGDASMVEDKETTGDVAGDVVETGEGEEAIVGEAGEEEASDGKDGEEEEEVGEADKATSPINGVE